MVALDLLHALLECLRPGMQSVTGSVHAAAYGANATHQMTEEALAVRQAALYGDAGTDESFRVDIPPKHPTDEVQFSGVFALCHPGL